MSTRWWTSPYWWWRQLGMRIVSYRDWAAQADLAAPRIAIVGNAGYLADHHFGSWIDGHDLVLRMNNFRTRGFESAVGARTDLYLTNFYDDIDLTRPELAGVRWVLSAVPNNFVRDFAAGVHTPHAHHIGRGMLALGRDFAAAPEWSEFTHLAARLGAYPSCGAMAIRLFTQHLAPRGATASLTGFSCFAGPKHYFQVGEDPTPKNHAPEAERRWLAAELAPWIARGQVTVDAVIAKTLGLNPRRVRLAG